MVAAKQLINYAKKLQSNKLNFLQRFGMILSIKNQPLDGRFIHAPKVSHFNDQFLWLAV
jgi:hypothetical protein